MFYKIKTNSITSIPPTISESQSLQRALLVSGCRTGSWCSEGGFIAMTLGLLPTTKTLLWNFGICLTDFYFESSFAINSKGKL